MKNVISMFLLVSMIFLGQFAWAGGGSRTCYQIRDGVYKCYNYRHREYRTRDHNYRHREYRTRGDTKGYHRNSRRGRVEFKKRYNDSEKIAIGILGAAILWGILRSRNER